VVSPPITWSLNVQPTIISPLHYSGYKEIADKYRAAVLGGAPFPDYLYTCGSDHDAGEDAHWNPFSAAAATYIRARAKPYDEATQKLIAFFYGVQSHYIAGKSISH
jgi:hypothetical protein